MFLSLSFFCFREPEGINFVLPFADPRRGVDMALFILNLDCPGLDEDSKAKLQHMRDKPYKDWDIDIWVLHAMPPMYHSFPSRIHNHQFERQPKYMIGRSMTEVSCCL